MNDTQNPKPYKIYLLPSSNMKSIKDIADKYIPSVDAVKKTAGKYVVGTAIAATALYGSGCSNLGLALLHATNVAMAGSYNYNASPERQKKLMAESDAYIERIKNQK